MDINVYCSSQLQQILQAALVVSSPRLGTENKVYQATRRILYISMRGCRGVDTTCDAHAQILHHHLPACGSVWCWNYRYYSQKISVDHHERSQVLPCSRALAKGYVLTTAGLLCTHMPRNMVSIRPQSSGTAVLILLALTNKCAFEFLNSAAVNRCVEVHPVSLPCRTADTFAA